MEKKQRDKHIYPARAFLSGVAAGR